MKKKTSQQIEQVIGYEFKNPEFLQKAITHSSSVDNRFLSNERLEFLGDAVLDLVICQELFDRFPNYLEGDLTKIKSMLVSRQICAQISNDLQLHKILKVGKGMSNNRALTGSLAAGLLEAVIAAVYVDGGLGAARGFILKVFSTFINEADAEQSQGNFKSILQQYAQQQFSITPIYELLDEKGPDHDKCFESQAVIAGRYFKSAWGTNKKEAEQKAAFNALFELGLIDETETVNTWE